MRTNSPNTVDLRQTFAPEKNDLSVFIFNN